MIIIVVTAMNIHRNKVKRDSINQSQRHANVSFGRGAPVAGNTGIKAKHGRSTSTVVGSGTGGSR